MSSIKINKNRYIFSDSFAENVLSEPLSLVDAGARGGLDEPWKSVRKDALKIIGFEPDKAECKKLNGVNNNFTYFPVALWSSEKKIKVYSTKTASCSSVYEPNFRLIKKYKSIHWEPRKVKKTEQFQASTLDKIISKEKLDCDFLKIDTQGAEYEILKGADIILQQNVFGVLLETWTTEVYKGQILAGDILRLMHDRGFSLFDTNIAAAWQRQTQTLNNLGGKSQVIGLDLLFFKESTKTRNIFATFSKLIKAVAIAEVFGFPDYAVEIINENLNKFSKDRKALLKIKKIIIDNSLPKNLIYRKIKKSLYLALGIKLDEYPSLHY